MNSFSIPAKEKILHSLCIFTWDGVSDLTRALSTCLLDLLHGWSNLETELLWLSFVFPHLHKSQFSGACMTKSCPIERFCYQSSGSLSLMQGHQGRLGWFSGKSCLTLPFSLGRQQPLNRFSEMFKA